MNRELTHRRRTKRLLWTILVFATAASISGNIAQAALHHGVMQAGGPVIAAALPPLALLSLTHLTGMWSRITTRGLVYWCFLGAVAAITAAAFRLSFEAQRALAVQYGYSRADAALFPLILDGLIAVATLGLVVLARTDESLTAPAHHDDAHHDAAEPIHASAVRAGDSPPAALSASGTTADAALTAPRAPTWLTGGSGGGSDPVRPTAARDAARAGSPALISGDARDAHPLVHASAPGNDDDAVVANADWALPIAHQLIQTGRTNAPLEAVHLVLVRSASGASSRPVAAEVGLSYSTVQRILRAAKEVNQDCTV